MSLEWFHERVLGQNHLQFRGSIHCSGIFCGKSSLKFMDDKDKKVSTHLSLKGFHKGVFRSSSGFGAKVGTEFQFCTYSSWISFKRSRCHWLPFKVKVSSHRRLQLFSSRVVINLWRAKSTPRNCHWQRRRQRQKHYMVQNIGGWP